ncbi:tyrosine-protein kinase domain-containing protein [Mycobacterium sp. HUMS_1102779]|uniref:AAA family ATPase n=1 Tax=Mycobacterium sp. HUMS_1102779 TaxID=3383487 RepID=UPI0038998309
MDFRTFVRILLAHWKLAMGALLACMVGAVVVTLLQTKHYQSSATVLVSFSGATDLSELYSGTTAAQEWLSSYAQIAGGRTVIEHAISQLQVPLNADDVLSQTKVKYTPKSMLLTINVQDTDPRRAAALAGAMADQFSIFVATLGTSLRPGGTTTTPAQAQDLPAMVGPAGKALPAARAKVVEPPRVPDSPVSPAPLRNMVIGIIAGVLLGVAVALTRDVSDRTVRTREKLEELSGLPTLAELPGTRGAAPRFGTNAAFDDAVRDMRARLRRAIGPEARRVLVTAPFGGEGTTTTVLNLSRAFAEVGEDVLVVEGDTRRSVIAGLLNVTSGEGLASALANPEIAMEAVKPTPIEKLFVLASRMVRRDAPSCSAFPPEVVDHVLADLSSRFDRVLIDGPPVLATVDTALLAGAVQATVLVVRARRTTDDELKDALTALRAAHTEIVGTVLTDARPSFRNVAAGRNYRAKVRG